MGSQNDVESQQQPNHQSVQGDEKKGKVNPAVIVIGTVGFTAAAVGGAYAFGFVGGEKKVKKGKDAPKPPKTSALVQIDLNKSLDKYSAKEFQDLLNTPEEKLDDAGKNRKKEAVLRDFVINKRPDKVNLTKESCAQIAEAENKKSKLALTTEQAAVLSDLLNTCKEKNLLTEQASHNGGNGCQVSNSSGQQGQPQNGTGNEVKNVGNDNNNTGNGNSGTGDCGDKPGIIEFLKTGTPTLKSLLESGNQELIDAFKLLNSLSDEERKTNLKDDEAAVAAFKSLLQKPLDDAYNAEGYVEDAAKQFCEYALANDTKITLTASQKGQIDDVLKRPSKATLNLLKQLPFGMPIDFTTFTKFNKEQAKAIYEIERDALLAKLKATDQTVSSKDLVTLYDYQAKLGFDAGLKLDPSKKATLTAGCDNKLTAVNATVKSAITAAGVDAEKYLGIYNAYSAIADAAEKKKAATAAIDYLCSKAIVEQAATAGDKFSKKTYQALCLALSAHDLLRGDLKTSGVTAGVPEIEYVTSDFTGTVGTVLGYVGSYSRGMLNVYFDIMTNWKLAKFQEFHLAIKSASAKTESEMKTPTASDLKDYISKQTEFVENLSCFTEAVSFLINAIGDSRAPDIQSLEKDVANWKNHLAIYQEELQELAEPKKYSKLIAEGANNAVKPFYDSISKATPVEELAEIIKIINSAKSRAAATDDAILQAKWDVLAKYTHYCKLKRELGIESSGLFTYQRAATGGAAYPYKYYIFKINAFVDALKENNDLLTALNSFLDAVPTQFDPSAVPSNNKSAELKEEIAKRIKFFTDSGLTHVQYVEKMNTVAQKIMTDVDGKLTAPADEDYLKNVFKISADGKMDLLAIDETELLSLLIVDLPLDAHMTKNITALYGLLKAYKEAPALPAVADDTPFAKFTNASNLEYIKKLASVKYIESSKLDGKFKYGGNAVTGYKWTHTPLNFGPLRTLTNVVDAEMNTFVSFFSNRAKFTYEVGNCESAQFPLNKHKPSEAEKDTFNALSTALANWAVQKKDALPFDASKN